MYRKSSGLRSMFNVGRFSRNLAWPSCMGLLQQCINKTMWFEKSLVHLAYCHCHFQLA